MKIQYYMIIQIHKGKDILLLTFSHKMILNLIIQIQI